MNVSKVATNAVAPRMGCVDRNVFHAPDLAIRNRRTPHGVRGLKYEISTNAKTGKPVAPRMGCVD